MSSEKPREQKVSLGQGSSVGSITQIMKIGIPTILILGVLLIAITQMTGYDLRPAIDTMLYGPTSTPSFPICTVTIREGDCLFIRKQASSEPDVYGCLKDGEQIQVTGIADPYYQISSYAIEHAYSNLNSFMVTGVEYNSPAQAGGLMVGDFLLKVDDLDLTKVSAGDMNNYTEQKVGIPIEILVQRDGEEKTLIVTPRHFVKNDYGAYYPGTAPLGITRRTLLADGLETDRAYVLGYSVSQSVFGGTAQFTSYVSCPTQLIQPSVPGE